MKKAKRYKAMIQRKASASDFSDAFFDAMRSVIEEKYPMALKRSDKAGWDAFYEAMTHKIMPQVAPIFRELDEMAAYYNDPNNKD